MRRGPPRRNAGPYDGLRRTLRGAAAGTSAAAQPQPAGGQAVPQLLAAKAVSNLFFLAEHPALSAPLRSMVWRLRDHWQAIEQRAASRSPAAATPRPGVAAPALAPAAEPWIGVEPARVWH